MRKTSVYLTEMEASRLAALARHEGRPQAAILRDAIARYRPAGSLDRDFAVTRSGRGSVADVPEEDLLKGFGAS